MAGIKTNRAALDNFVKHVKKFQTAQKDAVALLQRDYTSLGNEWSDTKYRQVGDTLKAVEGRVKAVEPELERLVSAIKKLERAIGDYEATNVG